MIPEETADVTTVRAPIIGLSTVQVSTSETLRSSQSLFPYRSQSTVSSLFLSPINAENLTVHRPNQILSGLSVSTNITQENSRGRCTDPLCRKDSKVSSRPSLPLASTKCSPISKGSGSTPGPTDRRQSTTQLRRTHHLSRSEGSDPGRDTGGSHISLGSSGCSVDESGSSAHFQKPLKQVEHMSGLQARTESWTRTFCTSYLRPSSAQLCRVSSAGTTCRGRPPAPVSWERPAPLPTSSCGGGTAPGGSAAPQLWSRRRQQQTEDEEAQRGDLDLVVQTSGDLSAQKASKPETLT